MSNFPFVTDKILRSNLDQALDHINELVVVSESKTYKGKTVQISSFRKTIIIHIAAIIEALLLWKLKKVCTGDKIELDEEWKYHDIKVLHTFENSEEIVGCRRTKEQRRIDKLDFNQTTILCHKHQIIPSEGLKQQIDKVREFRNRQHLGSLSEVDRTYSKADLEFCFQVAEQVIATITNK